MIHAWTKKLQTSGEKDKVATLIAETSRANWSWGPSKTIGPLKVPPPLPQRKRKLPHEFDVQIDSLGFYHVIANVVEAAFRKL